jgi:hypothetical protein
MKVEEAVAWLSDKGLRLDICAGLRTNDAVLALLDGYKAAVADIELITNVLNCDYTCKNKTDACKGYDKDKQCRGYEWRGPNPGVEAQPDGRT